MFLEGVMFLEGDKNSSLEVKFFDFRKCLHLQKLTCFGHFRMGVKFSRCGKIFQGSTSEAVKCVVSNC